MPYTIRKASKGGYDIVKKKSSGGTTKVGHSSNKKDAQASVRIREQAKKGR